VEDLWVTYKNKSCREGKGIERQRETMEIEQQRELVDLDAYLDKNIFGDDDILISVAADELSEWQVTTFQMDMQVTNPIQYWHGNRQ
jgi:hypothetical protein